VRPGRSDIAVPELPPAITWLLGEAASMARLVLSGPALVHFIDFAHLNSVRTLPYLCEWHRRYADAGLSVLGVQAPRFPFGGDPLTAEAGLRRLGVAFPVVLDSRRDLWIDYGCTGWPSLFLWGRGGALRWYHFGEGEYLATEEAIQEELRGLEGLRELPAPMDPLRASDAPRARVVAPSPELFPGGSAERPWVAGEDGDELALSYGAGGAYATVEGSGGLEVELDERPLGEIAAKGAGLYELVEHGRHESHALALRPSPGLRVWSLSFAAGVPG
jgi:hypothetical protein